MQSIEIFYCKTFFLCGIGPSRHLNQNGFKFQTEFCLKNVETRCEGPGPVGRAQNRTDAEFHLQRPPSRFQNVQILRRFPIPILPSDSESRFLLLHQHAESCFFRP